LLHCKDAFETRQRRRLLVSAGKKLKFFHFKLEIFLKGKILQNIVQKDVVLSSLKIKML
jgi:hypothetical protein